MTRLIAIILLLAGVAGAQTAKVVELKPDDAKLAQSLYAQKAEIDRKISDQSADILKRYIGRGGLIQYGGWDAGFEFSTDFKFIVPATPVKSACPSLWTPASSLWTPAYGSFTGISVIN